MTIETLPLHDKVSAFAHSLNAKGVAFIALLLAYAAFLVLVVLLEKDTPQKQLEEYQSIQNSEQALIQADLAAYQVITALFSKTKNDDLHTIVKHFTVLREKYLVLEQIYPEHAESFRKLVEIFPSIIAQPSRENFVALHDQLTSTKSSIDKLLDENRVKQEILRKQSSQHSNEVIITSMTLGIVGLILLGGITSIFFLHLTRDINRLQTRVSEIVKGYRGTALPTTRKDELGQLTSGINHMAKALKEREQELAIERLRSSYHEKMIAVESLASGIAHEIGNPVSCISGLAQELLDQVDDHPDPAVKANIQSIIEYSDGLSRVTRDLSVLTTPNDETQQLLDFNQLITATTGLLQYDQRWDSVTIDYQLNSQLPAITGYKDQLALLLTNILENSWYALSEKHSAAPQIVIRTEANDQGAIICRIKDNGKGMDEATNKRVFEPFYSTKPVGQGTGLGLALCWSIVQAHQGQIDIFSTQTEGTEVTIRIPVTQVQEEAAYG